MATKIRVLDSQVIDQIAAGEVVERPASVVKELIENSLDAGATQVTVDLEEGGLRSIRVVDDGDGMACSDADLCLLRHATSKLRCVDDLAALRTLGFRGEALSSIGSVSTLHLSTRRRGDEAGYRLSVRGGQVVSRGVVGAPPGTAVQVDNLFF
ncbi:MAG: DNA mismatch repair protein MutL, partial [Deltaproteobacteria bacterium]